MVGCLAERSKAHGSGPCPATGVSSNLTALNFLFFYFFSFTIHWIFMQVGLNVRWLGLVRRQLRSPFLRGFVLAEIVTRTVRHVLQSRLRAASKATSRALGRGRSCPQIQALERVSSLLRSKSTKTSPKNSGT